MSIGEGETMSEVAHEMAVDDLGQLALQTPERLSRGLVFGELAHVVIPAESRVQVWTRAARWSALLTEGSGAWLDVASFASLADLPGPAPRAAGRTAFGGLDIASTIDLTALAIAAPRESCAKDGHAGRCYDLRTLFWLPEANMADWVRRDHVPYDLWADAGWITLTPGNRVDQERIVADIVALGLNLRTIGIDRWNTAWLTPKLQAEGLDVVEVGQGYASPSAPAKRLEADIAAGFVHHDGNPVLRWMVANAAAAQDAAGNIKPDRERSSEKIDGVAAWCDALFAWAGTPEEPPPLRPLWAWR